MQEPVAAEARKVERGLSVCSGDEGPADGDGEAETTHGVGGVKRLEERQCMVGRKAWQRAPGAWIWGREKAASRARAEGEWPGGHCS